MAIADEDRCPKCGIPYMSMIAPGEAAESRYCYTCATTAGNTALSTQVSESADAGDEFTLQPLEGDAAQSTGRPARHGSRGNLRRQILSQARAKPVSNTQLKPVSNTKLKPVSNRLLKPVSNTNLKPVSNRLLKPVSNRMPAVVPPEATPSLTEPPVSAQELAPNAIDGGADTLQHAAPSAPPPRYSARHAAVTPRGVQPSKLPGYIKSAVTGGGFLLACGVMTYFFLNRQPPAPATVAKIEPEKKPEVKNSAIPISAVTVETKPAATPATPIIQKDEVATGKALSNLVDSPPATETKTLAEQPAQEKSPAGERKGTDITSLLDISGPRKAADAKPDDDDMPAKAAPKAPKVTAAAPPQKPINANPGKNVPATLTVPGLVDKTVPDAAVAVPAAVELSATEPTVMPFDIAKIDVSERTQAQQLAGLLPGWRVKDVHMDDKPAESSNLSGTSHRGKEQVLVLRPVNDVLPARLLATVEIPAKFKVLRPFLVFEISTKDAAHDWALAVKAQNIQLMGKTKVKTSPTESWHTVFTDLSAFAGKRFEVVIEAHMTTKIAPKFKDELAYFHNIHLEWVKK